MPEGLVGELYLLMFPSQQGRQFFQNKRVGTFIDFPDAERLVFLFVQHYLALPEFVPLLEQDNQGVPVATTFTNIVDSTAISEQVANRASNDQSGQVPSNATGTALDPSDTTK